MTLKQYKLIQGIKKSIESNDKQSMKDISIKAGYSIKTRDVYRAHTKAHIVKALAKIGYSNEELKARFNLISELTLKEKDYSNALRSNENIARMQGAFLDKSESKVAISSEKQETLNKLAERLYVSEEN